MFFDCKEAFEQIEIKYQQQLILSIYPPHDSSAFAASNPASSRRPCNRQEKKLIKHINITPSTGQRLHNGAPPPLSLSLYRQPSTTTPHQSYLSNRIPSHHLTSSHYARQPAVGWERARHLVGATCVMRHASVSSVSLGVSIGALPARADACLVVGRAWRCCGERVVLQDRDVSRDERGARGWCGVGGGGNRQADTGVESSTVQTREQILELFLMTCAMFLAFAARGCG
ncbi:uncharacterized protein BKA78DRAFT_323141 [Phyllosticta capitalensis]|uniref:uncharacterized protein n=1 Tax=Phyllosticta capitalensis TaxID=121624 RepID=UPI00312FA0B2